MKKYKLLFLGAAVAANGFATDIELAPGQLESVIASGTAGSDNTLILTGAMDARDFAAIEKLPSNVSLVDMSAISVKSFSSSKKYLGRTLFAEGELPGYAFFKSPAETVVLPQDLKKLGDGVFAASAVREIIVPEGVETIGDYAFYGCQQLGAVTLPSSLKHIGKGAFANCPALREVNLAATAVTELPERAFAGSSALVSVSLPANLSRVGREAFANTMISELTLSSVTDFEPYALSGMSALKTLEINPSANIGDGLLMDNVSLQALEGSPSILPAFFAANCPALESSLPAASAETIGSYALANNASTELILGPGVTSLGRGALWGMSNLQTIDVTGLDIYVPQVDIYSFEGLDQPSITLLTSGPGYDFFSTDPEWSKFNIKNVEGSTAIDAAEAVQLELRYDGSEINIAAPDDIVEVSIFTLDGRRIFFEAPNAPYFAISASDLPSGAVIVKAVTSSGLTKTVTLLNN